MISISHRKTHSQTIVDRFHGSLNHHHASEHLGVGCYIMLHSLSRMLTIVVSFHTSSVRQLLAQCRNQLPQECSKCVNDFETIYTYQLTGQWCHWNQKINKGFLLTIQYCPLSIYFSVFEIGVFNCGIIVWHKYLLEKLDSESALPNTPIPHHHQLVCWQVVAWHGTGRHGNRHRGGEGGK